MLTLYIAAHISRANFSHPYRRKKIPEIVFVCMNAGVFEKCDSYDHFSETRTNQRGLLILLFFFYYL